jgi:2-keto-3-deoxy-6-phosphogluconate aldolase
MKKEKDLTKSIGLGMVIGAAIGVATDNIGLWLSLGLVFGAGYGKTMQNKKDSENDNED